MARSAIARRREEVGRLLHAVNEDVARLPAQAMRSLYPALVGAEAELAKDLASWLAKLGGEERFTAHMLRQALYQVRGAMKAIEGAQPDVVAAMRRGSLLAAPLAQKHLQHEITRLSFRFGQSLAAVPLLQAAEVSQRLLLDRFQKAGSRWTDRQLKDLRHKLALGIVRGETVDQLTQRLLGPHRGKFSNSAPADKAGRIAKNYFSKARYEAERVIRTEVIHAYNLVKDRSIAELNREDPGYKRRWDAAIDGRTCLLCRDLDGQVAEVGKEFRGGYMSPPAHPFCRCAVVAWRDEWGK